MNDLDDNPAELDRLQRQALDWVDQLVSGEATLADAEAVKRWRALSPAHAKAFADAVRLRRAVVQAAAALGESPSASGAVLRFPRERRDRVTRRALIGGSIAAAAAGYALVRPPLGLWPSLLELRADYRTGTGERREISLANGVSVELNTQTSIAVRSTELQQGIELISGEASVTASLDPPKTFEVAAGDGRALAGRAKFNVRNDGPAVCVTCIDGAVRVERRGRAVQLQARQQVLYTDRDLGEVAAIDPAVVTAWRDGLLVFHDEPLSEVIAEVNRYRPGKIILANAALGRRQVNTSFRLDQIGEIVAQVQKLTGAQVTSLPAGVVLLN